MEGWISLHRKIRENWIWGDPVKLKWWLDIVMEVNHSNRKLNIGYNLIECNRGQTIMSLQNWAMRWNVSKSSARHFLQLLEKDKMIRLENMKFTTRITVLNYDSYNYEAHETKTEAKRRRNGGETEAYPNNNVKNVKNDKNDKKEIYIPTIEEFTSYALEKEKLVNKKNVELKYLSWKENDWKDGNDKKITNWKTKLLNTIPYLNSNNSFDKDKPITDVSLKYQRL